MDDVLILTTKEIGRTETNVVLYWVDRDTGPGFSRQLEEWRRVEV